MDVVDLSIRLDGTYPTDLDIPDSPRDRIKTTE